jgi:uncharacterized UBP type Zn finger protein
VTTNCEHFEPIVRVDPPLRVCSACVETGDTWFHLRQCLTCGFTGCCDRSPNQHATAHYRSTGHPMIRSAEPGEDWWWCYPDDTIYDAPAMTGEGAAT